MKAIKKEGTDSFFAAQRIVNRLKAAGFPYPPVLFLKKEIDNLRKRIFFHKRRIKQVERSVWYNQSKS